MFARLLYASLIWRRFALQNYRISVLFDILIKQNEARSDLTFETLLQRILKATGFFAFLVSFSSCVVVVDVLHLLRIASFSGR